ncbi:MAG: pyridoxamine 5'-phosphate oxidase family protein [Bacteroidetes bacterium]|jgi:nitroimidazol reductase NimA-like FMN-containing flavoprotein (pyridoxamine 5'-phosphate oxidase superfamily)|nr:pyridoxamine 5'-phosphate oxidase family protein [Bacteroidota bacterium]
MLGQLNEKQIETLLTQQVIGRLACHADGETYMVPLNYVYKDGTIYAHSGPGKKIDIMRKNANVCFEVEEIESIFQWRCVITWGRFEEITDEDEKQQVRQLLTHRLMPLVSRPQQHASHGIAENEVDIDTRIAPIVYKIKVKKATGRFEKA